MTTDILYTLGRGLYVNLTNKCPCRCTFCIRGNTDSVGSADNLWFEHEPGLEQVMEAFRQVKLEEYDELIFCGYGEPTCALDNLLAVCRYVRGISDIPIRLNTNGLSDQKEDGPAAQGACGYRVGQPQRTGRRQIQRPGTARFWGVFL